MQRINEDSEGPDRFGTGPARGRVLTGGTPFSPDW